MKKKPAYVHSAEEDDVLSCSTMPPAVPTTIYIAEEEEEKGEVVITPYRAHAFVVSVHRHGSCTFDYIIDTYGHGLITVSEAEWELATLIKPTEEPLTAEEESKLLTDGKSRLGRKTDIEPNDEPK